MVGDDAARASDGSDGDQQQQLQGQRAGRARAASRTPKDEILSLREDARALERVVLRLARRRRDALDGEGDGGRVAGKWKRLAYDQSQQRAAAVHENKKLRLAMDECRQLAASLLQLTQQPTPHIQELGPMEDSEWRMNMLGHHPRRRHLNADRIMAQLRSKLAGWAIHSGLVDVSEETRFGRCENRDRSDRAMHLEVNVCREFSGHYVDVASAVWRYFAREDLETGAAASVRVETSEILGDRIRHNTTGIRVAADGDDVGHVTHQLSQRIEEDARMVVMWKAVTEDLGGASHRFTENADGWISFEKAVGRDPQAEKCLMKCSSMALVLPLSLAGASSGDYLLRLVEMMHLPPPEDDPRSVDNTDAERARRAFADFLFETLWRHVAHIERLAAGVATTHMSF